jgi:hypothetical protein
MGVELMVVTGKDTMNKVYNLPEVVINSETDNNLVFTWPDDSSLYDYSDYFFWPIFEN